LLRDESTFTIVTAHQPNIFTGYLYFVYKLLHTIKLADYLHKELPQYNFVPVYYMGSEDADLEELGNIHLNGEKVVWDTPQKGAVGRMKTAGLEKIIERIAGELSPLPFSEELIGLLKTAYLDSPDVQTATFKLVHALFAEYGLVVILPDNPVLKKTMMEVFRDDLFNQSPSAVVGKSLKELSLHYKVQAMPREINLFYLKDNIRERIIKENDVWRVVDTNLSFTKEELQQELELHPERFSPNVILRGLFQETILPNIVFIGGGGETAYWLELKGLFEHYGVPYPVLMLRNSFLFVEKKWVDKIARLQLPLTDTFKPAQALVEELVKRESGRQLELTGQINRIETEYASIKDIATKVDSTLSKHVVALQKQAIARLTILEKKMLRSEKKRFESQQRQIQSIKNKLFPKNGLQERIDNFSKSYATYGHEWLHVLYNCSLTLEQQFGLLTISPNPSQD
jgi:bacillithiol biosynthesis cysteine-adding enzyme BshC